MLVFPPEPLKLNPLCVQQTYFQFLSFLRLQQKIPIGYDTDSMILKVFSVILKQLGFGQGASPCACRRARSLLGVLVSLPMGVNSPGSIQVICRHSSGRISSWKGWSGAGAAQAGVQSPGKVWMWHSALWEVTNWAQRSGRAVPAAAILGAVTADKGASRAGSLWFLEMVMCSCRTLGRRWSLSWGTNRCSHPCGVP